MEPPGILNETQQASSRQGGRRQGRSLKIITTSIVCSKSITKLLELCRTH